VGIFGGHKTIRSAFFNPLYDVENEDDYELFISTVIDNPSNPNVIADTTMVDALMRILYYMKVQKNYVKYKVETPQNLINPFNVVRHVGKKGAKLVAYNPGSGIPIELYCKIDLDNINLADKGSEIVEVRVCGKVVDKSLLMSSFDCIDDIVYRTDKNKTFRAIIRENLVFPVIYYKNRGDDTIYEYYVKDSNRWAFAKKGDDLTFLFDRIKQDGNKEPTREYKKIFSKYGTLSKSFGDIYENDDLKDFFYTLASKKNDMIGGVLSLEFGTTQTLVEIELNYGDRVEIEPHREKYDLLGYDAYYLWDDVLYNGKDIKQDGDDIMLVPIEFFDSMSLKDKYMVLKLTLGFLGYAEKTVKVKWYQTDFFKAMVVGALVVTGQWEAIGAIVATEVSTNVFGKNSIVTRAIQVYSIYNLGAEAFTTGNSITYLKLSSELMKVYVEYQGGKYLDEAKEYRDETEKAKLELTKNIKRQFMYNPLDEWDAVKQMQYNSLYNSFGVLDNTYSYMNKSLRGI